MPPDIEKIEKLSKMPSAQLVRVLLMIAVTTLFSGVLYLYRNESKEYKNRLQNCETKNNILEETQTKFYQDQMAESKAKDAKREREKEMNDSLTNIKLMRQEQDLKELVEQANKVLKKQKRQQ